MAETDKEVNGDKLKEGLKTLLEQNNSLFKQRTKGILPISSTLLVFCIKAYILNL